MKCKFVLHNAVSKMFSLAMFSLAMFDVELVGVDVD